MSPSPLATGEQNSHGAFSLLWDDIEGGMSGLFLG